MSEQSGKPRTSGRGAVTLEPTIASVFGHSPRPRRNEKTSRETIPIGSTGRFITVIVVRLSSRGKIMGKRGAKMKPGQARYPNGRIRPPTQEALNELNRQKLADEKSTVWSQPHRRGFKNPDDEWLAFAAGRFCRRHGVHEEVKAACDEWLNIERRWQAGYGVPIGFEKHSGGTGRGPTEEQMRTWLSKLEKVERAIIGNPKFWKVIFEAIRRLVIDDDEFTGQLDPERIKSALAELPVILCGSTRSLHPFRSAA